MTRILFLSILALASISLPSLAYNHSGGISLGQTRVIFSAANKSQAVTVSNTEQRAYLIQARVQHGLEDESPAPFIVTPPLAPLKGNSRQLLRLLPLDATLPTDRESLFYLSVSAIPAQSEPVTATDRLSVGVRFVLKLFYRPEGLAQSAETAACQLTFSRAAHGVRVTNPSAYFQTLGTLTLNGHTVALDHPSSMVAPQTSITLAASGQVNNVIWQTVSDHGGLSQPCRQTHLAAVEDTP